MRNYNFFRLLFLFVIFSFSGFRLTSAFAADPELESFLRFYKTFDRLDVSFHQVKKIKEIKMELKSEGSMTLQQPDQVTWEITKPSHVLAAMDKNTIRLETGEGKNKVVQSLSRAELGERKETRALKSLIVWMEMDRDQLLKEYKVTKLGSGHFQFDPLVPTESPFEKMEMFISQEKYLDRLTLYEKSKDEIEIVFGKPRLKFKK